MFTDFLYKYSTGVRHCILLLCLALVISCQSQAEKEKNLLAQDARARSELVRINQILNGGYPLTAQDFDSIKQIREKYPTSSDVRRVYQSALIKRGDWESLLKLIESVPETERTREDRLNLARSCLKLGRYQNAVDAVKPLADAAPQDAELNQLLASGYFYLGQNEEAARRLDAVWNHIVANKKSDEINMRGMIYFRQKNYEKAVETFRRSLAINPDDITANNNLSRVYAAEGNIEEAEIYRSKTEKAQIAMGDAEAKASRAVQNGYQLEDAWKAKRYEEVIATARQMLVDADEKNKPALYQYLVESYKALGRPAEAQKAQAEAGQVKSEK